MQTALFDDGGKPTLEAAQTAADLGMDSVLQHAEEIADQWGRTAYLFLVDFARSMPVFIGNDAVRASKGRIEQPHDDRAWGRIFTRAQRVGFIVFDRYVPAPHRHKAPCPQYRSTICSRSAH